VRLPKALDEDEVAALIDAAAGSGPLERRDRAVLELLYATGMRVSELVGLGLGDVRFETGLLRVVGKGDKQRLVPVGRLAAEAIEAWLAPGGRDALTPLRWARRGDAEALFLNRRGRRLSRQGVWGLMKARAAGVGLENRVHPHVLRHSCATHMLAHGADIRVVQEVLGHASVATTQVYTKVSMEHLRRSYEQAHPRAGRGRAK
jgi:integrase/recombinase XerD